MINEKFLAMEEFLNHITKTEGKLLDEIEQTKRLHGIFATEIANFEVICPFGRKQILQLESEAKKNPKDNIIAAKLAQKVAATQAAADRLEMARGSFADTCKTLEELEAKKAALNIVPVAEAAAQEQFDGIVEGQKQFADAINAAQEARKVYLEAIVKLGGIRSEGKHAVERLDRALQRCNKPRPSFADFETQLSPFSVSLEDIKGAYYRGKVV